MITLVDGADYAILFGIAAGLGAIGGVVYQLVQKRARGQTGQVEKGRHLGIYIDLGIWGDMIVGAIAAAAALWVFPPEIKTEVDAAGVSTSTTQYEIVKLVGLALIIGSAGSSFLTSLQAKALALIKTQEAKVTQEVAKSQTKQLEADISGGASTEQILGSVKTAKVTLKAIADSGPGNPAFE